MLSHTLAHTSRIVYVRTAVLLSFAVIGRRADAQDRFVHTNLASDVPGLALNLDPQLRDPWGISSGPASPIWIFDAATGVSTLYNGNGIKQGLVVSIPGPGGSVPGAPTGQVLNNTGSFALTNGSNASFLFANAAGTISWWNSAAGTTAITMINGTATGASYTGLAIAVSGTSARLDAANFGNSSIDVFDAAFSPTLPRQFIDPALSVGYAPFNVQNIGARSS